MSLSDRLGNHPRQIGRLAARTSLEILIVAAMIAGQISQPLAHSEPALALCNMDELRGNVPDNFPIAACVDGNAIWLRNNLEIPIQMKVTGDTGTAVSTPVDFGLATMSTRTDHPEPLLMMPGDVLKIPIGGGAASATIVGTTAGGEYLLTTTFLSFFPPSPVSPAVGLWEALADVMKAIAQAEFDYKDCLVGKNFLSQIGCTAAYTFQVDAALLLDSTKIVLAAIETVPVVGLVAKIVGLLLSTATYTAFLLALAPAFTKLIEGDRTITQSAATAQVEPIPLATAIDWPNATFQSTCANESQSEHTVTLADGKGSVPNPGRPVSDATLDFALGPTALGDITGDGRPESAAVLWCHQSDTSAGYVVWEIQVYTDGPTPLGVIVPTPAVGFRRVDFGSGPLMIADGNLSANVNLYTPADCNACGPSVHLTYTWHWDGKQFVQVAGDEAGQPAAIPSTDLSGEVHAFITSVDVSNQRITLDKVDWFTGADAAAACQEDNVSTDRHLDGWCDVYYYRNVNPMTRQVGVSPQATILTLGERKTSADVPTDLATLSTKTSGVGLPWELTVTDGQVTSIRELWHP